MIKKIVSLCVFIVFVLVLSAQDKPNVVFIFADDLGWGDLACYGHPYAKTPALDELASEGLRFERFYVTGVTCCPSRTGIMTSRHPARYPRYMAQHGFAGNITVTELFQQNGYTTGHFGKWHIGPKSEAKDGKYGIDKVEVIGGNKNSPGGRDVELFEAATEFIEENKDKPFYVNIWGHITHYAVDPVTSLVEPFRDVEVKRSDFGHHMQKKFDNVEALGGKIGQSMRNYLGDVYSLDMQVGRLMEKLDELGIAENTIVIFSSDQGPAPVGDFEKLKRKNKIDVIGKNTGIMPSLNMLGYAGGFRGGKHDQFEGGVRAPFIIRWPQKIPANRVNKESIVSGIDYLPSLCSLAGIHVEPETYEGENMADVLLGKSERSRKNPLFWKTSSANSNPSMLNGNWKLHKQGNNYLLYDLSIDEKEMKNVAEQYPEILNEMIGTMEKWVSILPDSYIK